MATFKSHTFGKISGKYGDALATQSKATGKNYLRVATEPSNPRTEKQVAHRAKFGFMNSVLVPFYPVFKKNFGGNKGIRYAVSDAYKNAITGVYPAFVLDLSKVIMSEGSLYKVTNTTIEKDGTAKFKISWDTTVLEVTDPDSLTSFVFFNEDTKQVYTCSGNATLMEGTVTIDMPEIWNEANIHVWLYFVSADGLQKSGSQYLGSLVQ
ncbi:MAG: DUF6266 family protein [Paludibacteraceae bacterium]